MSSSDGVYDQRDLRRFTIDLDDEAALESMQNEFFKSKSKPAAQVVRHVQPPGIARADQVEEVGAPKASMERTNSTIGGNTGEASDGNILDFAKRMTEAIKEFDIKERVAEVPSVRSTPAKEVLPQGKPKKLSLFAQRRLAKQKLANISDFGTSPDTTARVTTNSQQQDTIATFLPKLMAPVPEHTVTEPVQPPQQKPRDSGFPDIPVDVSGRSDLQNRQVGGGSADMHNNGYWEKVRGQISQENDDRVKGMTDEEILEAQNEIRSILSDKTIQDLLRRRQNSNSDSKKSLSPEIDSKKPSKQVSFAADMPGSKDNSTEEVDIASASCPPLPPPAEWVDANDTSTANDTSKYFDVDDNTIGNDGEFYANVKRKQFPSEAVEEAQLAWMLGHRQAKSPMEQAISKNKSQEVRALAAETKNEGGELLQKRSSRIRFDFDGQILAEEDVDIPKSIGLHHHGEEPDKPGYTIPELLHLSRSTVPSQRAAAMSTLGCIIHNINVGAWDLTDTVVVYTGLLDWQSELYFAEGIADTNKTGRAQATVALWTWVVEMARYKALVRLTVDRYGEAPSNPLPGAEVPLLPEPITAKGVLVERTFKAFNTMLDSKLMDAIYDNVHLPLLPEQQLTMLADCIKSFMDISQEFNERIKTHAKLLVLLQNKFSYLMSKQ
ncbi:hypothetical protein H4R24_005675 [Coemansia sp. RSA 988]|nr:hypothetical protein H4R24_005675 [Coemansia sp. RSA 988]